MIKIKFLSIALCFCMILSVFSVSAMAQATLEIGDFDYSNVKISVSADTGNTSVSEAMLYVFKSDGSAPSDANPPVYMDFIPLTDGAFSGKEILFPLDLAYDSYTVAVYYADASSPLTAGFNYYSPSQLLNARKQEILAEAKLAALSDAQALSDALFDIDSAGGTKTPTNEAIFSSDADLTVYNTVENKLEVYNRMLSQGVASLNSFNALVELFEASAEAQKDDETRETPVVPSTPSTDTTTPGNTKNPISVSRPSSSGGSSFGGSVGTVVAPVVSASSFADMNGHWADKYAKVLTDKKIINGYEDGSFKPENNVSRAEITKMLVTAFNVTGTNIVYFGDVAQGSWYYDFVRRASAAGIINGYDGNFNPDGSLSRQDASLMVFRVLDAINKLPNGTVSFKDDNKISDYASKAVKALGTIKVLNGDSNGNFNPDAPITRAEIAAVICRALEYAQLN